MQGIMKYISLQCECIFFLASQKQLRKQIYSDGLQNQQTVEVTMLYKQRVSYTPLRYSQRHFLTEGTSPAYTKTQNGCIKKASMLSIQATCELRYSQRRCLIKKLRRLSVHKDKKWALRHESGQRHSTHTICPLALRTPNHRNTKAGW